MSIIKTKEDTEKKRQQNIKKIEAAIGDKILKTEMAELRGHVKILKSLGIAPNTELGSIWGLVLFCENGVFFYAPASEGIYELIERKALNEEARKDQYLKLSSFSDLAYCVPEKTFFSFLTPENKRTVFADFTFNDEKIRLSLIFDRPCSQIYEELKNTL